MNTESETGAGAGEPGRVSSREIYDGRVVNLSVDTVRFPGGSVGELEMMRHPGAAAVLPVVGSLDEEDPEVVLVRQYRYATGGYIYEIPAGKPDRKGEPWEEVARRELEEETGLRPGKLRRLTMIYTTPGFTDEQIHLFLASELEEGAQSRDEDEFMEVVRFPFSRVLEMIRDGEITDGKTICTVLYAAGFVLGL
ncbi:MAG: NUDIX hydrolase [Gemmatimonadetes bacterium]|nr:NUDIX hydrolase [Gemmatimonadota bacterium]